jgi:hypothetical protein
VKSLRLALFLVVALAAWPAAARPITPASSFTGAFKALCLSTNADSVAALAEADRRGWRPVSAAPYGKDVIAARLGTEAGGQQLLLLSAKVSKVSDLPIKSKTCAVISTVDNPAAVKAFAKSLVVSIKPNQTGAWSSQWIFAQTSQGPREILSQAFAAQVIKDGLYRELMVSDDQTGDPKGNTALQLTVGRAP